jgi:hypothetical protein
MGQEVAVVAFTPDNALWVVPTIPIAAAALRSPPTRYFVTTTVFALIAVCGYLLVGWATFLPFRIWPELVPRWSHEELRILVIRLNDVAVIVACPIMLAVIWAATRLAEQPFSDYLALRWPSGRELARGLGVTFAFLLVVSFVGYLTDQTISDFVLNEYRSAKGSWWLVVLLISLCITAPLTEEFVVRGFLFRGWSRSFLGPAGSIVLTSAVWAIVHTQYNLFYLFVIFASGLLLGYLRYRSGSTWLTVVLHATINLASVVELALFFP